MECEFWSSIVNVGWNEEIMELQWWNGAFLCTLQIYSPAPAYSSRYTVYHSDIWSWDEVALNRIFFYVAMSLICWNITELEFQFGKSALAQGICFEYIVLEAWNYFKFGIQVNSNKSFFFETITV